MKIYKNKKRSLKLTVVATAVFVTSLIAYGLVANALGWWPFSATTPPSTQKPDTQTETTQNATVPLSEGDKKPVQLDEPASNANKPSTISGVINYQSVQDNILKIRLTIDQILGDGTCTLTLTQDSTNQTVAKSAPISSNPSSSTCAGFDVPLSELASGKWTIDVKISSGDMLGNITGEVTI